VLRLAGVGNIQITEMALEHDEPEPESLDLSGVFELLGRGSASPQERERVLEILRGGPEQARALLENIYALAGGPPEGPISDQTVSQVYDAMQSLDRLVLDEPFEDQPQLYANLASATMGVREPLRSAVIQTLVLRQPGNGALRLLGSHLSNEQLAQLIGNSVSGRNVADQVATFLHALCQDRQRAQAVLHILDTRLRPPDEAPNWLTDAVWPRLQPAPRQPHVPDEFDLGNGAVAPIATAIAPDGAAAEDIDEPAAIREAAQTLVDMLRYERDARDRKEINDLTDALGGYLGWLATQHEYALLATLLSKIREIASEEGDLRHTMAVDVLRRTAESTVVDGLLTVLWSTRGTVTEREVRACLAPLADHLVRRLVQALGTEERGGARAMLCDLIVDLYGHRIDELAAVVSDTRWYLVRNIAYILGRLRSPQAVAHLSRLVTHPDYRVRRETLNALAFIGSQDAQDVLAGFLDDPDVRLRLRAIQSLDSWEAWRAMPKLLAILAQPDFFNRQFELKQASLEALARLGAKQSLPSVKRMARAWFVWGSRGRELKRIAGMTAAIIEGHAPAPERVLPASESEEGFPP
jgi:hypothetical protein